jgi:hypothetical protein
MFYSFSPENQKARWLYPKPMVRIKFFTTGLTQAIACSERNQYRAYNKTKLPTNQKLLKFIL